MFLKDPLRCAFLSAFRPVKLRQGLSSALFLSNTQLDYGARTLSNTTKFAPHNTEDGGKDIFGRAGCRCKDVSGAQATVPQTELQGVRAAFASAVASNSLHTRRIRN